jgi:hypothetical protein
MQALLSEPPPAPKLFDAYPLPEGEGEGQPTPPADTKTIPLWPEPVESTEALEAHAQAGPGLCQECGTPLAAQKKRLCGQPACLRAYNTRNKRERRARAAKKASGGGA